MLDEAVFGGSEVHRPIEKLTHSQVRRSTRPAASGLKTNERSEPQTRLAHNKQDALVSTGTSVWFSVSSLILGISQSEVRMNLSSDWPTVF